MTKYDFNKIIDRRNTDCLKYDFAIQRVRPADVLPFWVADMDFLLPGKYRKHLLNAANMLSSAIAKAQKHIFTLSATGILSILTGAPKQNGSPRLPA